ncbi:MAG TPA: hypothetical protein V6D17_22760 [Candidatus Obscuribacterales bacterium]
MSAIPHPIEHPKIVARIRELAETRLRAGSLSPMFKQKWSEVAPQASELAAIGSELTGGVRGADHNAVLAQLFEPGALTILEAKSANAYWFWYLLSKLQTRCLPVTAAAMARAHARAKDSLHDNRYGFAFIEPSPLEYQLKQLPPGFFLEMCHKGRIVAECPAFGEYRVFLNPILIDD